MSLDQGFFNKLLGAGTGNYISDMATYLPEADFLHVDFNSEMNELARQKYDAQGLNRVSFVQDYVQRLELGDRRFDIIICTNALYTLVPQQLVLHKIYRWLKDDGMFFVVDFGRQQNVVDWGWYFIRRVLTGRAAVRSFVNFIAKGQQITKQGINGTKAQSQGEYWLHTTKEFGAILHQSGFHVSKLHDCYRGYCDLAVCHKSFDRSGRF